MHDGLLWNIKLESMKSKKIWGLQTFGHPVYIYDTFLKILYSESAYLFIHNNYHLEALIFTKFVYFKVNNINEDSYYKIINAKFGITMLV